MKSLTTHIVQALDIGGTSAPGEQATVINPQRIQDEEGAWQLDLNQDPDPGGGSDAQVHILGKLHPDAGYAILASKDLVDFDGGSGTGLRAVITGLPIVPWMKVSVELKTTSYNVAANTTLDVWIVE